MAQLTRGNEGGKNWAQLIYNGLVMVLAPIWLHDEFILINVFLNHRLNVYGGGVALVIVVKLGG